MNDSTWLKMSKKRSMILWIVTSCMYLLVLIWSTFVPMSSQLAQYSAATDTVIALTMQFFVYTAASFVSFSGMVLMYVDAHYHEVDRAVKALCVANVIIMPWSVVAALLRLQNSIQCIQSHRANLALTLSIIAAAILVSLSVATSAIIAFTYHSDRRAWRIFTLNNTNFGEEPLTFREYCQIGQNN